MKKIGLVILCLVSILAGEEKPYNLSLTIGGTKAESGLNLKDHINYGIRFGTNNNVILKKSFDKIEFIYEKSNNVGYNNSILETDINRYSMNFLHSYKNFEKIVPYALIGLGYEDFKNEYLQAKDSVTANLGIGLKYFLNDTVSLRAEVRDQLNLEYGVKHEMIYTMGLGYSFGQTTTTKPKREEPVIIVPIKQIVEAPTKPAKKPIILLDSDKDGIYDKDDQCPNTLKGFSVDTIGCAKDYTFDINFDSDKYNVKEIYTYKLNKFVNFMNMMPHYKAVINGYTDSTASSTHNMALSTKRAKAVMDKLIKLGLDKSRVSFKGYGEEEPIVSNDTAEGRAKNRRVEAQIIK